MNIVEVNMGGDLSIPFPPCLQKPLLFGDPDQIDAIKLRRREILKRQEREEKIRAGLIHLYEVEITLSGTAYIKIHAVDETHAENAAREMLDMNDINFEEDFVTVRACEAE